ncbi:MAG TPA: hypothetical protein ENK43_02240 [Planctomycetes bacterium]|nr:hypothetical protein [Planctomycetota bacterium]
MYLRVLACAALLTGALTWAAATFSFSTDPPPPPPGTWTVVAWNDLGMHCMDSDYSVFSILPPYNTVQAQVIDPNGDLVDGTAGVVVTYEAVADPEGSINTTSNGKTNYWQFTGDLFGASSVPDTGLAGHNMPGPMNQPQTMTFEAVDKVWTAEGVPLTPYDDMGRKRYYPLMRITARDQGGQVLATTDVVLPISDEMDCRTCHASNSGPQAEPQAGWVNHPNAERDFRLNILRLHDEMEQSNPLFQSALASEGLDPAGLYATVTNQGKSILCASCHKSNALPGTGVTGITPLTTAVHGGHANVTDPTNGMTLDSSANRSSCYRCHPGSETRCLRGAMGSAVASDGSLAMQCQSCHGNMSAVGSPAREGWLNEPACQNCHTGTALVNSGQIRFTDAHDATGQLRAPANNVFATTMDVPAPGLNLYRFSKGHGDLRCEACHGSTHAIYPASHGNDNLQANALQGHEGTIADCTACHDSSPQTVVGGPHGMHPIGPAWINDHEDVAEDGNHLQCRTCHGTDYKGTVLSAALGPRVFNTQFGTKVFWKGYQVGCYACHDGPTDDDNNNNTPPVVQNLSASTAGTTPVTVNLVATDANGDPVTLRIVKQPAHGTVGLTGTQATYYPEPGFAGVDTFTYAARDNDTESNLGTVTITRGAEWGLFGDGYAGGMGVPTLTASAPPQLGSSIQLQLGNSRGVATTGYWVWSSERQLKPTTVGGALLIRPDNAAVTMVPAGGLTLPIVIPNDPSLVGLTVYVQAVEYDPQAPFGYSFTRGLRLTLGQ